MKIKGRIKTPAFLYLKYIIIILEKANDLLYVCFQLCYNGAIKTNKVTNMKNALKTIGLILCLVVGVFFATIYKELVGFTGMAGYVIAVLGAALAIVAGIIMLINGFNLLMKKAKPKTSFDFFIVLKSDR